ncbi:crossover junction endonuclease MUS81 [Patagioenas fasciata]|uniref:crossover junction endonuclease MUS81 n=1 Tax=Patagioenas fasciata TaxID=372321 RepID=UPI003A9975AA
MAAAAAPPGPSRSRCRSRRFPNPLFARWLREWRDEAAGTAARGVYERALRSLSRFPLPLRSGRAAAILKHFGPALCRRLDERLRRHRAEQGLPPTPPAEGRGLDTPPAPPTHRPPRDFRPRPRSGSHALLLTLHQSSEPLPEPELLRRAQPLCDRPLTRAALGPPLRRNLLQRHGRPARYSLTPQGQILAQRLADAALEAPPPSRRTQASGEERPLLEGEEISPPPSPSSAPQEDFELKPGEFDIVLCADVTEANGAGGGSVPPFLLGSQRPLLLRRLHLGDFLWVAREKNPPPGHAPRELVLDVVIERKSGADLGRSLRDGRYREQKFRLCRSGLRFPVLLIEDPRGSLPVPPQALRQAAATSQVLDGLYVKRTGGPRETAAYLGVLGGALERRYRHRVLRSWVGDVSARGPPEPPGEPCALLPMGSLRGMGRSQPQSVGHVFARQLLQLGGLSGGGAGAVLRRFPTPHSLMAAYGSCTDPQQQEALLSNIQWGPRNRNLGPSLSRSLSQLYSTRGPLP